MKNDAVRTTVLSVRIIPNADKMLLSSLNAKDGERSLGIFTSDCDDVSYAALDEATKNANVRVAYAKSMYAGSTNASTKLAGEFLGILIAPDPAEVRSGLDAAIRFIENDASFYSANDDNSVVYFAHCISRTGSYLSELAKVPEGTPMAYLIAPPLEATCGIDAAL
jgi:ethanolamine utilization protein EutL